MPTLRPDQEEACHVGAGYQQDEEHGPEKDPERPLQILVSDHVLDERMDDRLHLRGLHHLRGKEVARIRLRKPRPQTIQIALGALHGLAGLQAADGEPPVAAGGGLGGVNFEGRPELGIADREREAGGHDADHPVGFAVDEDRAVQDPGVASEPPAPQAVAEDGDRLGIGLVVGLDEASALLRNDPQGREQGGGHERSVDALRLLSAGQVHRPVSEDPHPVEGPVLAPVEEVGAVGLLEQRDVDARSRVPQAGEAVRIGIGKGLEQDPVDGAEDRRVGSDADPEGQHRYGREAGAARQPRKGLPKAASAAASAAARHLSARRRDCLYVPPPGPRPHGSES